MNWRREARWLGAGFATALASTFGQTAFISVFAVDLTTRFELGQAGWAGLYAAATTLSAILMVWGGALADRHPLDRLAAGSMAGVALCCAGMAVAPGAWALVPLVLGLRLFGQGMLSHVAAVAMARWYVAARGRALAVAALGFAVGQAALPLAFTVALAHVAAPALWGLAAAVSLLAVPALARLLSVPRTPQGTATETMSPGLGGRHWTRAEVLRTPTFWLLVPATIATPAFGTAFFFFQTHLPEAKGWDQVGFVALFPLVMGVSVAATLAIGALIDRIGATRIFAAALLPMAAGFAGLWMAPTLGWAVPAVAVMALTMGAMNAVPMALWSDLFGTRHIGAVKAAAVALMVLGTALGPGLIGALIDRGIDFPAQMPWIAAYLVAAAGTAQAAVTWSVRRLR
ncbi:MFS transporter [Jannaschia sp. Os4]|uniref:MFS transporter n=1 Tax=Jannaschia sp. Os4 TaxID=2807617 RepID=UPI0019397A88|nr:MFS transporter [Jannaschia sp. Os4]